MGPFGVDWGNCAGGGLRTRNVRTRVNDGTHGMTNSGRRFACGVPEAAGGKECTTV